MKKLDKPLRYLTTLLGAISCLWFLANFFIFELLRPKMIRFQEISSFEENLINYVGIGWLLMTAFLVISLFRIAVHLKNKNNISKFFLMLLSCAVISILFIFGDLALINDIGKQYQHGLSQPEWNILYPVTVFQFITALFLTYTNFFLLRKTGEEKFVAKDSNVFTLVNFVGVICSFFGLFLISANFLFPRALWMIKYHVMATSIFTLIPYVLILTYWLLVKLKERSLEIYDEKQIQDIGISSFLSLTLSLLIMSALFFRNFNNLSGMLSVLWFPLLAFIMLFLFSGINLYKTRDSLG